MDRADRLRSERDSYAVKLREFVIASTKAPERLFCFFEGEDDKYYCVRIDQAIPNSNHTSIICKGKDALLHLHNLITTEQQYQNLWFAFFMDRDFDTEEEIIQSQFLYYTPCYSIENLYVHIAVFRKIIRNEFKISDIGERSQDEFESLVQLFQNALEMFHDEIEDFTIWRIIQNQKIKAGDNQQFSLDIAFKKLVSIDIINVEKNYEIDDLYNLFPSALRIEAEEWREKKEWIRQQREHRWKIFRGKEQIEFLRKLLTKLQEDANSQSPRFFSKQIHVRIALSKDNIISELSQYAITPDCLRNFLKRIAEKRPSNPL